MNTLLKALIGTMILVVGLIGLPVLIGLLGFMWPVLLVIGLIIFVPVAFGVFLGKHDKED